METTLGGEGVAGGLLMVVLQVAMLFAVLILYLAMLLRTVAIYLVVAAVPLAIVVVTASAGDASARPASMESTHGVRSGWMWCTGGASLVPAPIRAPA